jgi:peroxiredoxin
MKKALKIILMLVSVLTFMSLAQASEKGLGEGDVFEDFTLTNGLTKEEISFNNGIKGESKYTAIIFANTSCGACRKELKLLSELSAKHEGFTTYVILVDMKGAKMVSSFASRFDFEVTYLLDPEFSIPPIYGFYFTPSLLILDESGVIVFKKGGYLEKKDESIVIQKVEELMSK